MPGIYIDEVIYLKRIQKNRKQLIAAAAISLLLLAGAVVLFTALLNPDTQSVFSLGKKGNSAKFSVKVVEGYSESPIEGASVVVVDTGDVYTTDENGMTQEIEVPFVRDTRYDKIIPKPWGEVSIIIYKEGFLPYALFYLQVLEGETRQGVKILLFEKGISESSEPFSIIEGPNRLWVNELIDKFKPAD